MAREGLKRLEIWLPDNHPVWQYPPGQRAPMAREMLDLALYLEKRLRRLEEKLDTLSRSETTDGGNSREDTTASINPELFLEL